MEAKIKSIDNVKPYEKNGKTTFYHDLTLEGGEKINLGKQKELAVGETIAYELTGEEYNGYKKAKPVYEQKAGGFKREAYEERAALTCLSYAKDLVVADKITTEQMLKLSDKLYEWALKHKQ